MVLSELEHNPGGRMSNPRILSGALLYLVLSGGVTAVDYRSVPTALSDESLSCLECHETQMPGLVKEWRYSHHFGANVGCFECHAADPSDADAVEHNGFPGTARNVI
jgi:hydroxylamine dehydrogenase